MIIGHVYRPEYKTQHPAAASAAGAALARGRHRSFLELHQARPPSGCGKRVACQDDRTQRHAFESTSPHFQNGLGDWFHQTGCARLSTDNEATNVACAPDCNSSLPVAARLMHDRGVSVHEQDTRLRESVGRALPIRINLTPFDERLSFCHGLAVFDAEPDSVTNRDISGTLYHEQTSPHGDGFQNSGLLASWLSIVSTRRPWPIALLSGPIGQREAIFIPSKQPFECCKGTS